MLRRRRALTPEEIDERSKEAEPAAAPSIAARISKLVIGRKAGERRSTVGASSAARERVKAEPGPPDEELTFEEAARLELEYRALPRPRPPRSFDPGAAREASGAELRAAAGLKGEPSPREARRIARAERVAEVAEKEEAAARAEARRAAAEEAAAAERAAAARRVAAEKAAATRVRKAAERAAARAEEEAKVAALAEARRQAARQAAETRSMKAAEAAAIESAGRATAVPPSPPPSGSTARRIPTRVIHTPEEVRQRYHLPPAPRTRTADD